MHLSSVVSMWISSIEVACGVVASGNSIVVVDSIIVTIVFQAKLGSVQEGKIKCLSMS